MTASKVLGADATRVGPVESVAVIGAGVAGITAAAHLLRAGLRVTVFERSATLGGVWNCDPQPPLDPAFPSERPLASDVVPSMLGQLAYGTPPPDGAQTAACDFEKPIDEAELSFAPPSACYAGLRNNIPLPLMTTSLASYPPDAPDFGPWKTVLEYIEKIAKDTGVHAVIKYRTRVEEVRKDAQEWVVRTLTLEAGSGSERRRYAERHWRFDAVVVASGRFHVPRVPDIHGLKECKSRHPRRVIHSKQYRTPAPFAGANVLLIGGAVSSADIARELGGAANKVYQSTRGGKFDLSAALLPDTVERVAAVKAFLPIGDNDDPFAGGEGGPEGIIGVVELSDGRILRDVTHVVLATGYLISFPFLSHLHSDSLPLHDAGNELLVTADGSMVHNLHKDVFYIPEPTLAIVSIPFHLSAFPTVDAQAQVVARVFAGQIRIPSETDMRDEYREKVRRRGLGSGFHCYLYHGGELEYVAGLVDWVNGEVHSSGLPEMSGHSKEFVAQYWKLREDAKGVFADPRAWE